MSEIKISIIIPTLNEEEGIAKVICSIPAQIREISEVIVVDVSSDLTPVIAQRLGAKVLKTTKKGKGWQMRHGVEASKGEILVFLDGDGTDPADYIPKLLKKLEKSDLVLGCRSVKQLEGEDQKVQNFFYYNGMVTYASSYILGLKVSDPLAGFRVMRRKDWDKLDLKSNDFEIEMEMDIKAIQQGFIIEEVPIPILKRCGGFGSSKFLKSPNMWFKISKMLLDYNKNATKLNNF